MVRRQPIDEILRQREERAAQRAAAKPSLLDPFPIQPRGVVRKVNIFCGNLSTFLIRKNDILLLHTWYGNPLKFYLALNIP